MLLSDKCIIERINLPNTDPKALTIIPFNHHNEKTVGVPSEGLSIDGYDLMLSNEIIVDNRSFIRRIFDKLRGKEVSLKATDKIDHLAHIEMDNRGYLIKPGETILGISYNYIEMPRDVSAICMQKSTLARLFLEVAVTSIRPGWKGNLVVEIVNKSNVPIRIFPMIGICQIMFFELGDFPLVDYADIGKYQNQLVVKGAS